MKNELYFKNVTRIGDLFLEHILYEFETEPILFICSDVKNNLYLCLCSEIRHEQRWLITKTNINILKALVTQNIDVTTALCLQDEICIITLNKSGERSRFVDIALVDELDLPKKGTVLRCNKSSAEDYLWYKEVSLAQLQLNRDNIKNYDVEELVTIINTSTIIESNQSFNSSLFNIEQPICNTNNLKKNKMYCDNISEIEKAYISESQVFAA